MKESALMDENREKKVGEIKSKIRHGEYRIDVTAVADAILVQLRAVALARAERRDGPEQSARA
jgi:anti-sigma28 factor (negative regulator of flagellin synthesis)